MIGKLTGIIDTLGTGYLILDVQGVGYHISASARTLGRIGRTGDPASLLINTQVREDAITLFGFADSSERSMFRKLTSVSGIGARMALNLMSGMPAVDLVCAIENGDDLTIARTPGIGKKTAQRLILELQGKLDMLSTSATHAGNRNDDVRSALLNLGYKPAQVDTALKKVEAADFETMFRAALKIL